MAQNPHADLDWRAPETNPPRPKASADPVSPRQRRCPRTRVAAPRLALRFRV